MRRIRFITSEFRNEYPREFMAGIEKKYVRVISCRVSYKDLPLDLSISLHSDFAFEINNRFDGFIMFCNNFSSYIREIRVIGQPQYFNVWFKIFGKEEIEDLDNLKFVLELDMLY
jgi:hypothetical protein